MLLLLSWLVLVVKVRTERRLCHLCSSRLCSLQRLQRLQRLLRRRHLGSLQS